MAWPSTPASEDSWSITPQGTPEARCSASSQRLGERAAVGRPVVVGTEGQRDRHLERGRRRQAGADRDGGGHRAAEADAQARLGDDGGDVAGPHRLDGGGVGAVERDEGVHGLVDGVEPHRVAADQALALDGRGQVDGHGQHEAAGVVAVPADEVDPARGPHADPHRSATASGTARNAAAASSGTTGLTNTPLPSSMAAT